MCFSISVLLFQILDALLNGFDVVLRFHASFGFRQLSVSIGNLLVQILNHNRRGLGGFGHLLHQNSFLFLVVQKSGSNLFLLFRRVSFLELSL